MTFSKEIITNMFGQNPERQSLSLDKIFRTNFEFVDFLEFLAV